MKGFLTHCSSSAPGVLGSRRGSRHTGAAGLGKGPALTTAQARLSIPGIPRWCLAMDLLSACSHPCWFLLTLLLGLLLWLQRRQRWDPRKCPTDLTGKTVIVTGANSGEWWQGSASAVVLGVGLRECRTQVQGPTWPWDLWQPEPGVVAGLCPLGMENGLVARIQVMMVLWSGLHRT